MLPFYAPSIAGTCRLARLDLQPPKICSMMRPSSCQDHRPPRIRAYSCMHFAVLRPHHRRNSGRLGRLHLQTPQFGSRMPSLCQNHKPPKIGAYSCEQFAFVLRPLSIARTRADSPGFTCNHQTSVRCCCHLRAKTIGHQTSEHTIVCSLLPFYGHTHARRAGHACIVLMGGWWALRWHR